MNKQQDFTGKWIALGTVTFLFWGFYTNFSVTKPTSQVFLHFQP
jgi:hypothetical protein